VSYAVLAKSHKDYIDLMRALYARAATVSELSEMTGFSMAKTSEMTKELRRLEWARGFQMPNHTTIIQLTDKGKHALILLNALYTNEFAKKILYSLMESD